MTVSILMTVSSPRSLRDSLYLELIIATHSLGFLAGTEPAPGTVDGVASITS
jgi:hypothetical protein